MPTFKGDVCVGLFRRPHDLRDCHWGLFFLDSSPNDMVVLHAKGNYDAGWVVERLNHYPAAQTKSLLRLVHIGRIAHMEDWIQGIVNAVPAVNGDRWFDCKVWVMNAIKYLHRNGKVIVVNNDFDALAYELQGFADTAAFHFKSSQFDVRTTERCVIPGWAKWN